MACVPAQTREPDNPSLKDTLTWIIYFSAEHGGEKVNDGALTRRFNFITVTDGCSVNLVSFRQNIEAGTNIYYEVDAFSLADIAPERIKTKDESWEGNTVYFEVSSMDTKIKGTITDANKKKAEFQFPAKSIYTDSKESAERLADAFRHAVKLCGGKPSLF